MSDPRRVERERIRDVYRMRDRAVADHGPDRSGPAARLEQQQRERASLDRFAQLGVAVAEATILEVGCGAGQVLARYLELGARRVVGVDLIAARLRDGHGTHPQVDLAQADASELPFADATFDIVLQHTCLSSVFDPTVRRLVAAEMWRVVRPGGVVLSYDLRPLPAVVRLTRKLLWNVSAMRRRWRQLPKVAPIPFTSTRPVGRDELEKWFPSVRIAPVTLDPSLGHFVDAWPRAIRLLARPACLRTHFLAVASKPQPAASGYVSAAP